jgi:hypothetical protein
MSIIVVCPGCRKRFKVGDKFAGKSGPCPNCKYVIAVPEKSDDFVIHTPKDFEDGGRNPAKQLVLEPIPRLETKFNPLVASAVAFAAASILSGTVVLAKIGVFSGSYYAAALGLIFVSPILAFAAYGFLYDDEYEPHKGMSLWIRIFICGLSYSILWGIFIHIANMGITDEVWGWFFIAPPFLVAGAMVGATSLDLEFGNGFFHYSFYLMATILLRWAAGLGWIWNINLK